MNGNSRNWNLTEKNEKEFHELRRTSRELSKADLF